MFNLFAILDKTTSIQYKYRMIFVLVQDLNIGVFGWLRGLLKSYNKCTYKITRSIVLCTRLFLIDIQLYRTLAVFFKNKLKG